MQAKRVIINIPDGLYTAVPYNFTAKNHQSQQITIKDQRVHQENKPYTLSVPDFLYTHKVLLETFKSL